MKNKILIILILCLIICGCNYRELNDMSIITSIAIDKVHNKYKVSILIANSKDSNSNTKDGQAQTTVYSAKGKNLVEALKKIDTRSPKQLYFGHINTIIISEEIGKDGFLNIADLLLRHPETRKKFYIIQAKDCKAYDILTIVSPLESFPSQSISSLLETTKNSQSIIPNIDYNTFIQKILNQGIDPMIPSITIKGNQKKGSTEENNEVSTPIAYLKLSKIAVYKGDKFSKYISFKQSQIVNIINNEVVELKTTFNNISFSSSSIKTKMTIKNKNTISIKVSGKGFISEINNKTDLANPKTIKNIEKILNKTIKKEIKQVIADMQENETDVFGFGNKIYQKYPKYYETIKDKWNSSYFKKINVTIKVNLTINSTGSLNKTTKEVNQ